MIVSSVLPFRSAVWLFYSTAALHLSRYINLFLSLSLLWFWCLWYSVVNFTWKVYKCTLVGMLNSGDTVSKNRMQRVRARQTRAMIDISEDPSLCLYADCFQIQEDRSSTSVRRQKSRTNQVGVREEKSCSHTAGLRLLRIPGMGIDASLRYLTLEI